MLKQLLSAAALAFVALPSQAALVTLTVTGTSMGDAFGAWSLSSGTHLFEMTLVYDDATPALVPGYGTYTNAVQSMALRFDGGALVPQTLTSSRIGVIDNQACGAAGDEFCEYLNFQLQFLAPGAGAGLPSFLYLDNYSTSATSLAGTPGALDGDALTALDATRYSGFAVREGAALLGRGTGASFLGFSAASYSMSVAGPAQGVPEPTSLALAGVALCGLFAFKRRAA